MISSLPAGLMPNDHRVELFTTLNNIDHAYYLTNAKADRVRYAPDYLKTIIWQDMKLHPVKERALINAGFKNSDDRLEKYTSCLSGEFDGEADIVDGKLLHNEFWQCPVRSNCKIEPKVCNPLVVGPNDQELTPRESETLILLSQGLQNKEIAHKMGISEETVKVFVKRTLAKSVLQNRGELILLAKHKNLI